MSTLFCCFTLNNLPILYAYAILVPKLNYAFLAILHYHLSIHVKDTIECSSTPEDVST